MIVKAIVAVALVLAASGAAHALRPAPAACLLLEQGWVRAPMAGRAMTAGYGQLHNRCAHTVSLVGLHSAQARHVELHRTEITDGISRMRPVPGLQLAAGQHVSLEPGGLHLMLHGLQPGVVPGSQLELEIDDGNGHWVYRLPVRAR
jgi:copper(I)-binding protein